jgi:vacuolar-type H+-ATPase subunit E/Vma4
VLETAQRRSEELTKEARTYAERLISETVQRSRSIARDTEELVSTMLSDTESQLSDIRRQQGYLNEYLQRMRQAATEVDMEITSIQPPKLTGDSKPLTSGDPAAEEILEAQEVPVTIDVETSKD